MGATLKGMAGGQSIQDSFSTIENSFALKGWTPSPKIAFGALRVIFDVSLVAVGTAEGEGSTHLAVALSVMMVSLAGNVSERHVFEAVQKTGHAFVLETVSRDIIWISLLAWWPASTLPWYHMQHLTSSAFTTTHHHN